MFAALQHEGAVIFLEHKLLSETWLEMLGSGARRSVHYDVPSLGNKGPVPEKWQALPFGQAVERRAGEDVTIISVGVGVHRALQAAQALESEGISAGVLDLRTLVPLDRAAVCAAVARTGRMVVVDEDYEGFGLSGELAAVVLEAGIACQFGRVCTRSTIPYTRQLEDQVLPNTLRICDRVRELIQ
jgi:pyruvate dehydrogenase E1 component beta subunit